MFATVGALVFFGSASFALVVITQMIRGYRPLIMAALRQEPMPRTVQASARISRRRLPVPAAFTPCRLERERAAA
jgi:hypothetical protein